MSLEFCFEGADASEVNFWLWLTLFFMLSLVIGLAVKAHRMLQQTSTTLDHVWNQVADTYTSSGKANRCADSKV